MNKMITSTLVAATFAMAGTAFAAPDTYGPYSADDAQYGEETRAIQKAGYNRGHRAEDVGTMILTHLAKSLRRLDLDEAQKTAFHEIMAANREDLKANFEASKENRMALHAALIADPFVEADLATAAELEGDLVAERVLIAGSAAAEILALLTPEQREELETIKENRRGKGKGPKG